MFEKVLARGRGTDKLQPMNPTNGEIKIEKKVPLPSKGAYSNLGGRNKGKGKWQTILSKLQVGDSFFVGNRTTSQLSSSIAKSKKHFDIILTMRTVEGGVRIWRVK